MTRVMDKQSLQAQIIPRSEHSISRADISKSALKVLYRLNKAGHQAYLVGGSVRDLLLGKHPKDFDVVTDAHPEQIRKLFSNSIIIGKRFRLVHVRYGHDIVEVATFRGGQVETNSRHKDTGMIIRDNVFGEMEDDVLRRDFTVNALYYNIADFSVVDYVNGMSDIKTRTMRLMGEPKRRYVEDPVRMLRCIRLAAKLDLEIEPETAQEITNNADLIINVASARLFDEMTKMSLCGHVTKIYHKLVKYQLFEKLFPVPFSSINEDETGFTKKFVEIALHETDTRIAEGKTINPAFLIAVYYWMPLQNRVTFYTSSGEKLYPAMAMAEQDVLKKFLPLSMPKRLVSIIRDIWRLQYLLSQTRRNRIYRCYYHPRFRAAYDFMLIRNKAGEDLHSMCDFWTEFQAADHDEQERMISQHQKKPSSKSIRSSKNKRRKGRLHE